MVAGALKIFTTEQVAMLVGLDAKKDKWRVIKFAESEEYKITPSISAASGSGSRRLYDVENVCEIALALHLLESGLRAKVIGKVIRLLREKGKLSTKLKIAGDDPAALLLAISRAPAPGKPLDQRRDQAVEWLESVDQLPASVKMHPNRHWLFVPLRSMFSELNNALRRMELQQLESQKKDDER